MLLGLVAPDRRQRDDRRPAVRRPASHPQRVVGAALEATGFHPGRTAATTCGCSRRRRASPTARVDEVLALVGLTDAGAPAHGRATRSGCASGSAWPPPCSPTRGCCCSTSPPTASTPRASPGCAASCGTWPARAAPSWSPATCCPRCSRPSTTSSSSPAAGWSGPAPWPSWRARAVVLARSPRADGTGRRPALGRARRRSWSRTRPAATWSGWRRPTRPPSAHAAYGASIELHELRRRGERPGADLPALTGDPAATGQRVSALVRAELLKLFTTRGSGGAMLIGVGGRLGRLRGCSSPLIAGRPERRRPGRGVDRPGRRCASIYTAGISTATCSPWPLGILGHGRRVPAPDDHPDLAGQPAPDPGRRWPSSSRTGRPRRRSTGVTSVLCRCRRRRAADQRARRPAPAARRDGVPRTLALGVLAVALWAVFGLGIATLIRNQVAALLVAIGFAWIVQPILSLVADHGLDGRAVAAYLPPRRPTRCCRRDVGTVREPSCCPGGAGRWCCSRTPRVFAGDRRRADPAPRHHLTRASSAPDFHVAPAATCLPGAARRASLEGLCARRVRPSVKRSGP